MIILALKHLCVHPFILLHSFFDRDFAYIDDDTIDNIDVLAADIAKIADEVDEDDDADDQKRQMVH